MAATDHDVEYIAQLGDCHKATKVATDTSRPLRTLGDSLLKVIRRHNDTPISGYR